MEVVTTTTSTSALTTTTTTPTTPTPILNDNTNNDKENQQDNNDDSAGSILKSKSNGYSNNKDISSFNNVTNGANGNSNTSNNNNSNNINNSNSNSGNISASNTPTPTPINNGSTFDILPYSRTLAYRTTGRPRKSGSFNFKEENIQSYTDSNGIVYRVSGEYLMIFHFKS